MTKAEAEAAFPIADLYSELGRVISLQSTPLEDTCSYTKQELRDAISASKALSIKPGMPPRYDLFHNVYEFVRYRLDVLPRSKSVLLGDWGKNAYAVLVLYDYSGAL